MLLLTVNESGFANETTLPDHWLKIASVPGAQPAQANAEAAQQALAQAAAALALAEAGVGTDAAQGDPAGQPPGEKGQGQGEKGQGQGQQPGQGQAQGQSQAQGKGQAKGPGQGQPKEPGAEGKGKGEVGNWQGAGGADGPLGDVKGRSNFIGLPKRDRNAIIQSQTEKYPEEFGSLVEQYLKNLSDQATGGKNK